jgi:hypothetical protein
LSRKLRSIPQVDFLTTIHPRFPRGTLPGAAEPLLQFPEGRPQMTRSYRSFRQYRQSVGQSCRSFRQYRRNDWPVVAKVSAVPAKRWAVVAKVFGSTGETVGSRGKSFRQYRRNAGQSWRKFSAVPAKRWAVVAKFSAVLAKRASRSLRLPGTPVICRPLTRARSGARTNPRLKPGSISWSRLRRQTRPA